MHWKRFYLLKFNNLFLFSIGTVGIAAFAKVTTAQPQQADTRMGILPEASTDEGFDRIMVSIPSGRDRATVHRTVAFNLFESLSRQ